MKNQQEKPLVSMIIPTYNRVGLLQEALDSLNALEGVGELFEIEVIVVDDGSSDATPELMRRYPGIQYIRLETNHGQYAALNIGIRACRGKYVALLDDDDLCLPQRLKVHVPVLESRPEVGVVYGQIIVTGDGPDTLWPDARRAPSGSAFRAILMEEFVLPHCVMIRRDAFEKAGYFDENLRTMGHYEMFLRLAFHVPFAFVPGPVAIGRFSESAKWFTNIVGGGYVRAVHYIIDKALNALPDTPERTELRRQAHVSWLTQIVFWLERAGQIDQMRSYVLTALKRDSWMMTESWAVSTMAESASRVARKIAGASESPITAVGAFCAELKASIDGCKFREWLRMHWLLAYVWAAVAFALGGSRSPIQRWAAGHAAFSAVLHNPAKLRQKALLRLMIRAILASSRWDPVVAAFRKRQAA